MSRASGNRGGIATPRRHRTRRRLGVLLISATLTAGLITGQTPTAAASPGRSAPVLPHDKSIPVTPVTSHYQPPKPMPAWHPAPVTWPTGTATVSLPATPATNSAHPVSSTVQAGTLPVWLGPATNHTAMPATPLASTEHVSVLPHTTATATGVTGVVVSLQRSDANPGSATEHLSVNYSGFRDAFGGDWASRLHLVQLPACALTTPAAHACRTQTPLPSTTDLATATVSGDVTLAGATQGRAASTIVVAATSAPSGGGSDFTATSLQPSGSWQAGGAADGFSWSYPIPVPSVPGGLQPTVGLSYDSQSVDGLTSSTNNQPSWIGDGWDYSPGFVERAYTSCAQNPAGPTKTGDTCWSSNNTLTLSLGGRTSILVQDDATGTYHPQNDSGERVQYLGAPNAPNGVQGNEHFVVTTTDGTQYYFGLNQLPGFTSGNQATNSVWTEPVYATANGQPCYNPTFAASWCQQAYRWNLDYVVDTHADAVSYFYATETNAYAADNGTTANASYIRAGYLTKIQYGQRSGQVYSTAPAAQVVFNPVGRCQGFACDPNSITPATASNWPDVPEDLACTANAACSVTSPGFWSNVVLGSIQTQALVGSTETNVDSWTLAHSFPATGDVTTPVTWLSSITHTGQDPNAIGSPTAVPPAATSPPITLPPVVFTGMPLTNRVLSNGYPPITRQRLTQITTETGEIITVGYSPPSCATVPADPSQNTSLCFPDYWTPPGQNAPILDWFNKFIVQKVTQNDATGGSANNQVETDYTPVGNPGWHHNDNPTTPTAQRTWDQWRGYPGIAVSTGKAPNDPVTQTQYTYFRGMNGDTLPGGGTRAATVTDSRNDPAVPDANQFAGDTYETVVSNGAAVVTDTITTPWASPPTGSHGVSGLPTEQSFLTGTADTRVYTPLANASTRQTQISYTHDSLGRVTKTNDLGDVSTPADDLCTTTSYADNTTAWILDKMAETATVSVNCTTTPSLPANAVSDSRTFYDSATTVGAAPTIGDVTMTQQASSYTSGTPNLITIATTTVDQYGRTLTATNGDGKTTTTSYTPATGAEPISIAVTDPKHFLTTTTYDPLRNLPQSKTDPAKYVSSQQYDALGRLTVVNKVGVPAATKYSYTVSNTGPSVVDTNTLNFDGSYRVSETLYDSLLRAREVQTQTPDNQRLITDTTYNSDGWVSAATDPYLNGNPVAPTYVQAQAGDVPSATAYTYDAAGRKTAAIAAAAGSPTWQTSYTYGGNFTTTIPPSGGTATTTFTDARGHTTDLYQYHTGVPVDPINDPASDYSATHYTYTPAGKQATVVDAAGNSWSYQYDLLGQQTTAQDPDTGTTTTTYDNAGLVTSVTDGRGKQTTTTYDDDARKTAQYDTTGNATPAASNKTAAWTYDTAPVGNGPAKAVGYPVASTAINGGDTYTQTILGYNSLALAQNTRTNLTGTDAALVPASGYFNHYNYLNGYLTDHLDDAAGGLPAESIGIGMDAFGQPTSLGSPTLGNYVEAVGYSEYGQVLRYTLPSSGGNVWLSMAYDQQTHALNDIQTTDSNSTTVVDDTSYNYGGNGISPGAGLVTSTTDNQNAGASVDTQCFRYDYARRLSAAWTGTDQCNTTPAPGNSATVGGPAPYWQSWTYDPAGDRATQTDHNTAGVTANDTTTNYTYPTAGSATDQPHTLTSTTATGPAATTNTASYTYDAVGNTTAITGGAAGNQTLTWTDRNKLASDTTANGTIAYVYDASGNLVVRRDPGQTTMFLGDEQLVLNTTSATMTATRYYSIGGVTIADRNSSPGGGLSNTVYLVPDRQGTDQLTVDSATYAVTRRQYLPFGQTRGTPPTTWFGGDTGYVGGTPDPTTSLESLGAREYNPANGRFISADPILELTDPTQMGGYDYAGNNPVTSSDPTGLAAGSWCVTAACAAAGNNSPGLTGYGVTLGGFGGGGTNTGPGGSHGGGPRKTPAPVSRGGGGGGARPAAPTCVTEPYAMGSGGGISCAPGATPPPAPHQQDCSHFAYMVADACETANAEQAAGPVSRDQMIAGDIALLLLGLIPIVGEFTDALAAADIAATAGEDIAATAGDGATADGAAADEGAAGARAPACHSFAGSTMVLMADHTNKPIDQITVGDQITDSAPGVPTGSPDQKHTVTALHVTYTDRDYTDVTVATPHGPATITGTNNHPYWDTTTHHWTPANQLHTGDQLQSTNGYHITITAIRNYTTTMVTYDLTINTLHTYYIEADTTPILVHNCDPGETIAKNIADHANGEALRPAGDGTHFVRGVDSKALPEYVHGVIDGDVPNVIPKYGLNNGREAYWDPGKGSVVIVDGDSGTVFTPKEGRAYFDDLR